MNEQPQNISAPAAPHHRVDVSQIKTENLVGRPVHIDDMGLLYRMYTNEEVMYTLGGVRTFGEAKDYVLKMASHWDTYGFGVYLFFDKNTNDFVGRCGFKKVTIETKEEIELLYAVMPTQWGKGYATEICNKLIQVAFEELHFKDIVCLTAATNKVSMRVMEKSGFVFEKNFTYNNEASVLYRLKKS